VRPLPGEARVSAACHHQGVGTVLGYIIALLVVGGLLFLAASYTFGRGEEMAPVLPDGTPVELPDDRLADGDDLRALRLSVAVRGYRMDEVDWLLDRLSEQVDTRDREIARLRSVLHVEPVQDAEPELLTHPFPAVVDASDQVSDRGQTEPDADAEDGADADGYSGGGSYAGWRPRPVPEGTGDTGARPNQPVRHLRTTDARGTDATDPE
jgi:DivIVA domain-containing protein